MPIGVRMRRMMLGLTVVIGLCRVAVAAAPDAGVLAESCAACHGAGGVSAGPSTPSLAGQPVGYFVAAMTGFRSGARPSTIMAPLARGYSDAELAAMGAYFAALKPQPQTEAQDAAESKAGMKVYFKLCRTCHLDGSLWRQVHQYRAYDKDCSKSCHLDYGAENGAEIPLIGGQWAAYLDLQLDDFRHGRRPMSPRKDKAMKALSDADARAVARFYAGLKDLQR